MKVPRHRQPYMQCAPTCLAEVMEYFTRKKYDIKELIEETKTIYKGMDWIFLLGLSALKRGFKTKVITSSTEIFDPSWINLNNKKLLNKIERRIKFLSSIKRKDKYITEWNLYPLKTAKLFIENGGELVFSIITKELIKHFLKNRIPVIAPVNENIFFGIKRTTEDDEYSDIRGFTHGHYIVISGFSRDEFIITDSDRVSDYLKGVLKRKMDHVICSILTLLPVILVIYKGGDEN
ncbi:MAG: hypothetical protein J7K72_03030 [Candidatus Aenigmarchaeota archaeon]|nr:hypothetical protein [Candidatus Aenigmarchaeota archaeon]